MLHGRRPAFTVEEERLAEVVYRIEGSRGHDQQGDLFSPGFFRVDLGHEAPVALVASSEPWDVVLALRPDEAARSERARREGLLERAPPAARSGPAAELVLAADAFVVEPAGRCRRRARAEGYEPRTVIAGPWFTDWGRDTMISLEGLTLYRARRRGRRDLLAFARHVRDGLIPNLFPEGTPRACTTPPTRRSGCSTRSIGTWRRRETGARCGGSSPHGGRVRHHVRGTRYGIGVDPSDGLLRRGAEGYALTWMDAKFEAG